METEDEFYIQKSRRWRSTRNVLGGAQGYGARTKFLMLFSVSPVLLTRFLKNFFFTVLLYSICSKRKIIVVVVISQRCCVSRESDDIIIYCV